MTAKDIWWPWLTAISNRTGHIPRAQYSFLRAPFAFDKWVCASDGRILLAVEGYAKKPETVVTKEQLSGVGAWIERYDGASETKVSTMKLNARCRPSRKKCETCQGTRLEPCDCSLDMKGDKPNPKCDECHGTGKAQCLDCPDVKCNEGLFWGVAVNRNILRVVTERCPDATVVVQKKDARSALRFVGKGWVALVMPLQPDMVNTAGMDRFPDIP